MNIKVKKSLSFVGFIVFAFLTYSSLKALSRQSDAGDITNIIKLGIIAPLSMAAMFYLLWFFTFSDTKK